MPRKFYNWDLTCFEHSILPQRVAMKEEVLMRLAKVIAVKVQVSKEGSDALRRDCLQNSTIGI